jgi:hypothetical protein
MRRALLLFLTLAASPAGAQVIAEMTPERIQQAIAAGKSKPGQYSIRTPKFWMEFDTPFLRVARKAGATEEPTPSVATPELVAPVLQIQAAAEPLGEKIPAVKKVVAVRADGSSVPPTSHEEFIEKARISRRSFDIKGIRAVFPIAVLEPGTRFKFSMSDGTEPLLAPDASWFKSPR